VLELESGLGAQEETWGLGIRLSRGAPEGPVVSGSVLFGAARRGGSPSSSEMCCPEVS
jgi:hypothetical protein